MLSHHYINSMSLLILLLNGVIDNIQLFEKELMMLRSKILGYYNSCEQNFH